LQFYSNNKQKEAEYNKKYKAVWYKKNRRRLKEWFWEYKKTLVCTECGADHPAVIDFHHPGKKEAGISEMLKDGVGKDTLLAEV